MYPDDITPKLCIVKINKIVTDNIDEDIISLAKKKKTV